MSEKPLQGLIDLKEKAEEMWTFKGRAELIRKIGDSVDFIKGHRFRGSKIPGKIFKERLADYEVGVKIMDEKYKEIKSEGVN